MHNQSKYLALVLAFLIVGCSPADQPPVAVRNACNTFVSESAPRKTPELRKGKHGLELVISFTPAPDPEAEAILDTARNGPVELIVHPGLERLHALGEEGAHLVLSVASEAEAKRVEKLLCF